MSEQTTAESILDSAKTALSRYGLQRVRLDDVARDAGVTRQTVYRYYGSKRALLAAVMDREVAHFLDALSKMTSKARDVRSGMVAATEYTLRYIDEHALFQRLLEDEAETLLTYLARDAEPVLRSARALLVGLVTNFHPELAGPRLTRAADANVRLVLSYGVTPARASHRQLAEELTDLFCDGLLGATPPTH